jgi:hypothetical protein
MDTKKSKLVLVTGAIGKQGGAALKALLTRGASSPAPDTKLCLPGC